MLEVMRMAQITDYVNALGTAHQTQKLDQKLFGICMKGAGFLQDLESWQRQKGFSQLTPEAQQMFRDIWGDQKFEP